MKPQHYAPAEIEPKWQDYWEREGTFKADADAIGENASIENAATDAPAAQNTISKNAAEENTIGENTSTEKNATAEKSTKEKDTANKNASTEKNQTRKAPCYILDMFPYPSGAGLHIGHPVGYTATDALKRFKKAQGHDVLHPMGWDAFGLPTEQYAIQTGQHPRETTARNVQNFKKQLKLLGLAYDWSHEINTSDPNYYRFTQWIFLKLFQHGLTDIEERFVWYCPKLSTVLANEEILQTEAGPRSERGQHPVERRKLRQWTLRITHYADKLLEGLDALDWPAGTKALQRNWIGRREGLSVQFKVKGHPEHALETFTTRADTLYGVTYLALAPEHPHLAELTTPEQQPSLQAYLQKISEKSERQRASENSKTGIFTGSFALHPIHGKPIPIYAADYVLSDYGSGAVMGVPAHDPRDYAFAEVHQLPIVQVIEPSAASASPAKPNASQPADFANPLSSTHAEPATKAAESAPPADPKLSKISSPQEDSQENSQKNASAHGALPYTQAGRLRNSGPYDGLDSEAASKRIAEDLRQGGKAEALVNYKLRDWLFSRQRYWGEPFPILWIKTDDYANLLRCKQSPLLAGLPKTPVQSEFEGISHTAVPLLESSLPLELPEIDNAAAQSFDCPLDAAAAWKHVALNPATGEILPCAPEAPLPKKHLRAFRETNTMPQWAGSCWYHLRYLDAHNPSELASSKAQAYWRAPMLYLGGAEHAVLHLLYARFWHRFLYDIGVACEPEPYPKLYHQGLILGNDGEKMSKSRGNVINPESIIAEHGADALRLYLMFLGPLDAAKPWDAQGIAGINRFLKKLWRLSTGQAGLKLDKAAAEPIELRQTLNDTIKKVSADYETLNFNTAIAQMMICLNQFAKAKTLRPQSLECFLQLLAPLAPHISEELWSQLGHKDSIAKARWPAPLPIEHVFAEVQGLQIEIDGEVTRYPLKKLAVQVNGKRRGEIELPAEAKEAEAIEAAKEEVARYLEGKKIQKAIYVPARIVNFVLEA